MLLDELHKHNSVEAAAKAMAGNWQNWRHFAWLRSSQVHKPENILLSYTKTFQTGVKEAADHEVVAELLKPYYSEEDDPHFIADDYGASFCGDKDALHGFAVRVYDDEGKITEAFEKLYELAMDYSDEFPIDEDVFERVNREHMHTYLEGELTYQCGQRNIPFSMELVESVVDVLAGEEDMCFDHLTDDDIERVLDELTTPAK